VKGSPPIVDGDLHKAIKPAEEESYWTLEDSKEVTIFLQKVRRRRRVHYITYMRVSHTYIHILVAPACTH
jgi:hypothetical protein